MCLVLSEPDRDDYHGYTYRSQAMNKWTSDDIGRAWRAPHRTGDFVDTIPTKPAPLEAHGCWEPPQEPADQLLDGYARGIVSALIVGAIVAFVLVVTQ